MWKQLRSREHWVKLFKSKKFYVFFLIILFPNILRQVIYYLGKVSSGSIEFIASYETQVIFNSSFPWIGVVEEVLIGLVFAILWFHSVKFVSYAWLNDALFDYVSVFCFLIFGVTPLQALGLSGLVRFLLREAILSYLILGPLFSKLKLNIKIVSLIYSLIGLGVVCFVLLL